MDFRRGTDNSFAGSFPDLRTLLCNTGALRLFLLLSCMIHLSVMGAFSELRTGLLQGTTAGARSYTLVARRSATAPGQQGEKQTRESKTAEQPSPAQQEPAPVRKETPPARKEQETVARPTAKPTTAEPVRTPLQPARDTKKRETPKQTTAPADELRALTLRTPPSAPTRPPKRASKKPQTPVEKPELAVLSDKRQPAASRLARAAPSALPVAVAAQELSHLTLAAQSEESEDSKDQQALANENAAAHVQRSDTADRPRNPQAVAALTVPSAGASFTPPRYQGEGLSNPMPRYPYVARVRGLEGRVLLQVEVSASGKADAVNVQQSSGHRALDRAALKAVRGWRFTPGMLGTETVAGQVTVPVVFRLK